jgi:hypothetical protein
MRAATACEFENAIQVSLSEKEVVGAETTGRNSGTHGRGEQAKRSTKQQSRQHKQATKASFKEIDHRPCRSPKR